LTHEATSLEPRAESAAHARSVASDEGRRSDGRERKSLRNEVHNANAVVWEPV
jgi:hypothetical protein